MALHSDRGVTLIEILFVMSLAVVLVGMAYIVSIDSLRSVLRHSAANTLVTALQHARAEAMSGICDDGGVVTCTGGVSRGVHITTDADGHISQYVLFQGPVFTADDVANEAAEADSAPLLSPSSVRDVLFAPFSGTIALPGVVSFTDETGQSITVTLGHEGQISWDH